VWDALTDSPPRPRPGRAAPSEPSPARRRARPTVEEPALF
jgi:hypothetical protein